MIVNHFNTFPYGGAATAAMRLHRAMLAQDVKSRFLYDKNERNQPEEKARQQVVWQPTRHGKSNPIRRQLEKRRIARICKLHDKHLASRDQRLEVFSMAELVSPTRVKEPRLENQIVHLHWVAFMADLPSFLASIPSTSPVVWTLHDMNPLTGGCHYSSGCERFKIGCGTCPQVVNPSKTDVSRQGFKVKQRAYRQLPITVVTPSVWLKQLAESSPVFPGTTKFHHIRLGFDLQELSPQSTTGAREQLGLPTNTVLIGFGAETISNRRKGVDLLLEALTKLPNQQNVECVVFGTGGIPAGQHQLPKIHTFGFVDDARFMANIYSACDIVVVPSREDNQPQVGLEAMACGTPVVGFDVGGVGEYITPGVTGFLAEPEQAESLANQIDKLVVDQELRKAMAVHCRNRMLSDFDLVKQSKKYIQLYHNLLQKTRRKVVA